MIGLRPGARRGICRVSSPLQPQVSHEPVRSECKTRHAGKRSMEYERPQCARNPNTDSAAINSLLIEWKSQEKWPGREFEPPNPWSRTPRAKTRQHDSGCFCPFVRPGRAKPKPCSPLPSRRGCFSDWLDCAPMDGSDLAAASGRGPFRLRYQVPKSGYPSPAGQ